MTLTGLDKKEFPLIFYYYDFDDNISKKLTIDTNGTATFTDNKDKNENEVLEIVKNNDCYRIYFTTTMVYALLSEKELIDYSIKMLQDEIEEANNDMADEKAAFEKELEERQLYIKEDMEKLNKLLTNSKYMDVYDYL